MTVSTLSFSPDFNQLHIINSNVLPHIARRQHVTSSIISFFFKRLLVSHTHCDCSFSSAGNLERQASLSQLKYLVSPLPGLK